MPTPYIPVGDVPFYSATTGSAVAFITTGTVNAYTQTYATADPQLPAMTAAVVANAVADTPPAGGTGANAGGWDTAGNRDIAITTINEEKTLLESLKTQHTALTADVLALKKVLTAIIDDMQGHALLG